MIFQDGHAFKEPEGDVRAQNVMDNLIYRREIPVMIGVFINPGRTPDQTEPSAKAGWGDGFTNRRTEYNTPDDKYARIITEELMPALYKEYNISKDPEQHGIGGSSSGAIAAFMVAWERPDAFRKVLSNVGSFTNLRGRRRVSRARAGRAEEADSHLPVRRPQRSMRGVRDGKPYDQRVDWFYQNVRLMKALTAEGLRRELHVEREPARTEVLRHDSARHDALAVARRAGVDRSERHGGARIPESGREAVSLFVSERA